MIDPLCLAMTLINPRKAVGRGVGLSNQRAPVLKSCVLHYQLYHKGLAGKLLDFAHVHLYRAITRGVTGRAPLT